MAIPKITGAQRDFSAGEVDEAFKRADEHPARKAGVRQMVNWRILNSGVVQERPGRSLISTLPAGAERFEEIEMVAGTTFRLMFGNHLLNIYSSAGALLATFATQGNGAALPWTTATAGQVVFAVFEPLIFVTFAGMKPQVITWNGVVGFTIADYAEAVIASGQKRTPFYRLSPQNVTMLPNGITGNIRVQFSAQIASPALIGTRMRYCSRQILLTGYVDPGTMNALVVEPLPPGVTLTISNAHGNFALGDEIRGNQSTAIGIVTGTNNQQYVNVSIPSIAFQVGDAVTGATSGATGIVTAAALNYPGNQTLAVNLNTATAFIAAETITGTPSGASGSTAGVTSTALTVQLLPNGASLPIFVANEVAVGPSGSATIATVTQTVPQAVAVWDDEIMNSYRGYPASVFVDQFRLGFCNFPALPNGISWSAINSPTDLYVDAAGDNAIFQLTPDKVQVLYVVPGPESSEFVLCNHKVYYIPITATDPLAPGSVSFQLLSSDGAAQVQPRVANEVVLYAGAGGGSMRAIIATGAYQRPFNTKNITIYHTHLFSAGIVAIAAPTADLQTIAERYIYALKADGSIAVGKYALGSIEKDAIVGWSPWTGAGAVSWIAALNGDVLFTTSYFGQIFAEILDDTQYLDGAVFVNNLPAALAPAPGKGPLWFIASQTATLLDLGTRQMGVYNIDANGFIIPQNIGGENLLSAQLVAGQAWTGTLEPFVADANPGNSVHQRMFKRRVSRMAVYVSNSTGFLMARLFSGPLTRTSPALGTVMNTYRVPTYNQDDDATQPPPLREEAQRWRPLGRSFDPRVAVIKDTPGPIMVHEFGVEATI